MTHKTPYVASRLAGWKAASKISELLWPLSTLECMAKFYVEFLEMGIRQSLWTKSVLLKDDLVESKLQNFS